MSSNPRVSLGLFGIFFGLGLSIILRGDINDTYSGILVCCIALMQLFDYGIGINLECYPGGSNDKATRGLYILMWLMPAILCFSATFFANHNVIGLPSSNMLLLGVGTIYLLIAFIFSSIVFEDRNTWCSTPGAMWQPNYGFLHNQYVPMKPNILLLAGLLLPTLLVDPYMLGLGTLIIMTGALFLGRKFDRLLNGEWLSSTTIACNSIALWALFVPPLRRDLFFINPTY